VTGSAAISVLPPVDLITSKRVSAISAPAWMGDSDIFPRLAPVLNGLRSGTCDLVRTNIAFVPPVSKFLGQRTFARGVFPKTSTPEVSLVSRGKYQSRPIHAGAEIAETRFEVIKSTGGRTLIAAEPVTGKTHQIRVQRRGARLSDFRRRTLRRHCLAPPLPALGEDRISASGL